MITQKKVNRHSWLAVWLQSHRRKRKLFPAPVLVAQYPSLAVWQWNDPDPFHWNAFHRVIGLNNNEYFFDDFVAGTSRQYAPDGGQHLMFIVGVDENGNEITHRSNAVRPDDAVGPPAAPSLGLISGNLQISSLLDGIASIRFYFSLTVNGSYVVKSENYYEDNAQSPCDFDPGNGFWKASVVGDGASYVGESAFSNIIEVDTCGV